MCNDFTAFLRVLVLLLSTLVSEFCGEQKRRLPAPFLSQTCFAPPEVVTNRRAVSMGIQVVTNCEESLTLRRRILLGNIIIMIYIFDLCLDIPAVIQISKSH